MHPLSLVRRRREEAACAAKIADIEYAVLDNYDGRLQDDIATREQLIGFIRAFGPDIIFTHRTNDYHPDHRHAATLVQGCSYLMKVPHICPTVPVVSKTPVILHLYDGFTRPIPFAPDIVVAIDDVFDAKVKMLGCHASQFYEWLPHIEGYSHEVPAGEPERLAWLHQCARRVDGGIANRYRALIDERYGQASATVSCAEVFEVSEYGRPLPKDEVEEWMPR